ncbi:MAG: hypothetical protein ACI9G1_001783 [Pirellulaceae bacterium]|jgi:hypothetical protein
MFQLRSTSRRPASKSRRICRAKRLFIETLEARQLLATINVGPGLDFATIQEAVNNARPNDVLEIVNGTYNEAINLNSMGSAVQSSNGNLTIRGESLDTIVVSPGGPALFNSAAFSGDLTIEKIKLQSPTNTAADDDMGVQLINYSGFLSMDDVTIDNSADHGMWLENITGDFSLRLVDIVELGTELGSRGLTMIDVDGSGTLFASALRDVKDLGGFIQNNGSTQLILSILSTTVLGDPVEFLTTRDGLIIEANDDANIDLSIVGNNLDDLNGTPLRITTNDRATLQMRFDDNISFNNVQNDNIIIEANDNSELSLSLIGNTFSDVAGTGIQIIADDSSRVVANLQSNLVFTYGVSKPGTGILLASPAGANATVIAQITENNVINGEGNGIHIQAGGTSNYTIDLVDNSVSGANEDTAGSAILVNSIDGLAATINLAIDQNSVDETNSDAYRLVQSGNTSINVESDEATLAAHITNNNIGDPVTLSGFINTVPGGTFDDSTPHRVGGILWNENTVDGIRVSGEFGVDQLSVSLTGTETSSANTINRSTITDLEGKYSFTGLLPGSYTITVTTPDGRVLTLQDQGSDEEVDSDFSPSTREFTVNLGNADILNSDAGFVDTSFLFWQNPRNRFDVNDDNTVEPLDVLQLVNYINIHNSGALPIPPGPDGPPPYVDVSGDNRVAPIDALQLINFINNSLAQGQGQGQGEGIVDLVATDVATAQDGSRDGQALLANDDAIVQWANGPTTRESISLEARSDSGSESLDDILGVIAADIAMG